jgi:hypothetical protein
LRLVNPDKWKLEALLSDTTVDQYLDKTVFLSASDSDSLSFEKKVGLFMSSSEPHRLRYVARTIPSLRYAYECGNPQGKMHLLDVSLNLIPRVSSGH